MIFASEVAQQTASVVANAKWDRHLERSIGVTATTVVVGPHAG